MENQELLPITKKSAAPKMIVRQETADQFGLKVGDEVQAELFFESPIDVFEVASIVEDLPNFGDILIDWENNVQEPAFQMAYIVPTDINSALSLLPEIKSQFPGLTIASYEQSLEQSKQMFAQRWSIFIVVLAVILFSVMLGVVNTLINNIHSRRKEYAVLRAISLSQKGIIQVVMTQVTTYLLIGLLFGSSLGIVLTYVISLVDSGSMIQFNFQLIAIIIGVMVAILLLIFIPFANKIGELTISEELTQDNK